MDGCSRIRQFGKMLGPDPPDHVARIVLVLGQPQLALFGNDIKDLEASASAKVVSSFTREHEENVIDGRMDSPPQPDKSGKDTRPHASWFRY